MHQRKDLRTILPFQIYGAQFKMTFFLILFIPSQTKQKNEKGTARFFTSLVCLTLSVRFTTYRFLRSEVFKIASDVKTKCSSSHRIVHALVRFIIHFKYVRDSLCELCVFVVVVVVVSRRRLSFSPVFVCTSCWPFVALFLAKAYKWSEGIPDNGEKLYLLHSSHLACGKCGFRLDEK